MISRLNPIEFAGNRAGMRAPFRAIAIAALVIAPVLGRCGR